MRTILKYALVFLLVVLLVLAGGLAWLTRTEQGRAVLTDFIEARTADSETARLRIKELGPKLPFVVGAGLVTLADDEGVWLRIEGARVVPDWSRLLRGEPAVELVGAELVRLARLPESGETDPAGGPEQDEEFEWPPDLPAMRAHTVAVERFELGEELLGREAAYRLDGTVDFEGETRLVLGGLEGEESRIEVATRLGVDELVAEIAVSEPRGGLLAALAGLPDSSVSVDLRAEGPLSDVALVAEAEVGDWGAASLDGTVSYLNDVLGWAGRIVAELGPGLLPVEAAEYTGRTATVDIVAEMAADGVIRVESLDLDAETFALAASGRVDPGAETLDVDYALELEDPARLLPEGLDLAGLGEASGSVSGPLEAPEVTIASAAQRLGLEGAELTGLELRIEAAPQEGDYGAGLDAEVAVEAAGVRTGGQPYGPVALSGKARLPDYASARWSEVVLKGPGVRVASSGSYGFDSERLQGQARIERLELAGMKSLAEVPVDGVLTALVELASTPEGIALTMNGDLAELAGLEPLPVLAGDALAFGGRALIPTHGEPTATVSLRGGLFDATGSASFGPDFERIDAEAAVAVADLTPLSNLAGLQLGGEVDVLLRAKGPIDAPEASLRLDSPELVVGEETITDLELNAELAGIATAPRAVVSATGRARGEPVGLEASAAVEGETVLVEYASLTGFGTKATLGGRLDMAAMLADARLSAEIDDVSRLGGLAGLDIAGAATIDAVLAPTQEGQALEATIEGAYLDYAGVSAAELDVAVFLDDLFGKPFGRAGVGLREVEQGALRLESVQLDWQGAFDGAEVGVLARGEAWKPIEIDATGQYTLDEVATIYIATLTGEAAGRAFVLAEPARAVIGEEVVSVERFRLGMGEGSVAAAARLGGTETELSAELDRFPLVDLAGLFTGVSVTGDVDGTLELRGPADDPRGQVELAFSRVRSPARGLADLDPADATLTATLGAKSLQASFSLQAGNTAELDGSFSGPLQASLAPVSFQPAGAVDGSLSGRIDLAAVPIVLQLSDQSLQGEAEIDLAVGGAWADPRLTGEVRAEDGQYENYEIGLLVRDISLLAAAEGRTVELERLSGDDGEGGAVEMTGRADLGEQLAFRVAAALEGFTPMRTDDLEVTLSSPELVFEGGPSAATLRGEATLDRARLVVPELGGEGTPDVDVTEVNVPPAHRRDQTEKDGDYRLELDVAVDIPGRFVVIGQGLDAEFRGRIKATGTTDEPRLAGKLDIVRGEYDFLARRFTIEQATISFDGSQDPTPFLNIRAEADASDATAIVRVQGRADSPQIELSSQPALPRDEILSRVLFGKSVDQITPVQAVILADAARQLAQGGGGAGFFGRTRQAIGLDELDVVGDGDEGYALQFGKYVTDRVYVEVEKGLEPERDKVKVEVEVTDDVSVESRAGQESSGVGVFWKHDY